MSQSSRSGKTGRIVRDILIASLSLVAIVVIMLWLMGVFKPKVAGRPAEEIGRPVGRTHLVRVEKIRVPQQEAAVGTVQAVHETSLGSKLLAKVTAVHAKAGQTVTKGALLIELDDADLRARRLQVAAAVEAARAKRDQARIEFDRVQRLIQQDAATRLEQDQVTHALKAAEANLQQAEQTLSEADTVLSYTRIHSPIDGLVVDKKVEVGDTVQPGQVLVTLYDPTRMQLVARVRESLAHRLQVGKFVPVRIDALDLDCEGLVSEIVPEAESTSRTFSVKVTGPCPPGVYAGMFGRLLIPLDEEEVLVIPREAVRRIGQMDVVDVAERVCEEPWERGAVPISQQALDDLSQRRDRAQPLSQRTGDRPRASPTPSEAGRLHRRAIEVGREIDGKVQVLAGLREGEQVAVRTPASQAAAKGE